MLIKLVFDDDPSAGLQTMTAGSSEYSMISGQVVKHHVWSVCDGSYCCIHNPSVHSLSSSPMIWRSDREIMERICEHGIGHPDHDSIMAQRDSQASSVHGCDGCCQGGTS